MSKSLQEQLLAAGLVDKKRAAELEREKRREKRRKLSKADKAAKEKAADDKARAARQAKAEQDRELERKRQEKKARKALAAEIRQLVLAHRVDRSDGDIAHRFVHHGKVKQIYVDADQQKALGSGALVIVRSAGKYDLVPLEAAQRIGERDERAVIRPTKDDAGDSDGYEGYEVPDDLMW